MASITDVNTGIMDVNMDVGMGTTHYAALVFVAADESPTRMVYVDPTSATQSTVTLRCNAGTTANNADCTVGYLFVILGV